MGSSFAYTAPTIVWFADGGVSRLGSYLKRLGAQRVLLVCDAHIEASGIATAVRGASGDRVVATWAEAQADAPRESVTAGAEAAKSAGADAIVAVGGGSAIDSGKAIALLAKHGGDVARWDGPNKVGAPGLPVIAIPTTAGTGSEATDIAVVKDETRGRKLAIIDRVVYPAVAILDPRLTVGLPPILTAATGMDALTHAIEGIVSTLAAPICTAVGLECVRMVRASLERAVKDGGDIEARGRMLIAASMAGQLVSLAFVGVAHAVAHALGVGYGVHHGTGNALALPWSIRFNATDAKAAAAYARCAEAFGVEAHSDDRATSLALADAIEAFSTGLGLPGRLSKAGVARGELERLAKLSFADPSHGTNPVKIESAAELERALVELA